MSQDKGTIGCFVQNKPLPRLAVLGRYQLIKLYPACFSYDASDQSPVGTTMPDVGSLPDGRRAVLEGYGRGVL